MNAKNTATKTKFVSKGERASSARTRSARSAADRMLDLQRAWLAGQNPWMTIANPNPNETNKRFIRVRANDLKHDPKFKEKRTFIIPSLA